MMAKKKRTPASLTSTQKVDFASIARQAQLEDLRLLESVSSVTIKGAMPSEVTQTIAASVVPSRDGKLLIARLAFSLSGTNEDGSEGLRVGATFGLTYHFSSRKGVTDEMINDFFQVTGLGNVWPYWREFVQSMIGRMGLPPFHVPLLRPDQLAEIRVRPPEIAKSPRQNKRNAKR